MSALALLLLALAFSAMFAGSETAFYGLNRLRLRHDAATSRAAALLENVLRSPSAFLATLLIGNNIANDIAVHAATAIGVRVGLESPEFWSTLCLTPLVFLFGEVLPKQLFLDTPRLVIRFAAPLAVVRLLFWPLTAPLAALARRLDNSSSASPLARRQLEALLQEGEGHAPGEARVMKAALRAMDSRGKGLRPFLRFDLPMLRPDCSHEDARQRLARSADAIALLDHGSGPPSLLLGTRLVDANPAQPLAAFTLPLLRLPPQLDLAAAVAEMRTYKVAFAWVEKPGEWAGLCDLEYALARLLAPAPPVEPSAS
jgi:putative hemolysin